MQTTNKLRWSVTLIVLSLFGAAFPGTAQDTTSGIQFFNGTFSEARIKAKSEGKYLFLDAFAAWCGPCKTMDKEVYSDPAVGDYFRLRFVSVRIDMEKGEGPELAKKLPSVDGYPSLLFFNPDGSLSKTILGSRKAKDFLEEAKLVAK